MNSIRDRVLNDNGHFVESANANKADPRDKEILVLKEKLKQHVAAVKQKNDVIMSIKSEMNESDVTRKQDVISLGKEVSKLNQEIILLQASLKEGELAKQRVAELEEVLIKLGESNKLLAEENVKLKDPNVKPKVKK